MTLHLYSLMRLISNGMKHLALILIKAYQKTISPDHGIFRNYLTFYRCRFYPTCSEYCYQAIERRGFFKGLLIGFKRIKRCHPWNEGGYDPLN